MGYFKELGIATLAFLCLLPGSANAFTLWQVGSDVSAGWQTKTLSVDLDPGCASSTSIMPALNAAIAAWNGVSTSNLTLSVGNTSHSLGGSITSYLPPTPSQYYVGNPLIYCDTNFDSDTGNSPGTNGSGIPGVDIPPTLKCSSGSTYCPLQGGIILLNFDSGDKSNIDTISQEVPNLIAVIVAHELGHALGIGHSADPDALMYYNASQKTQLLLAQDDVNAISYLYPRDELGGDKLFGCGTVSSSNDGKGPGGPGGPFFEFGLLILACFGISRLRPREPAKNLP